MKNHAIVGFSKTVKPEDIRCILYAKCGLGYSKINKLTSLTNNQIYYRLKKSNNLLREYRNGFSPLSKKMIQVCNLSTSQIAEKIKKQLVLSK